ncbi:hypothetical protein ACWYXJ_14725 [Janthinobacterium lividum]
MSDNQSLMANATVAAKVDLNPQGSQTLLVGMIVLAGLSLILGAMLLGAGNNAGWAFVALSLVPTGIAGKGWFAAHSDADLNDANPTVISSTANGLTVSTDSRTLRSHNAAEAMVLLIEVSQRRKLPNADAIFENGAPIPDSAAAANVRVQQINDVVDEQARSLETLLNRGQDGPTLIQRPAEMVMPPDDVTSRLNVIPPPNSEPSV